MSPSKALNRRQARANVSRAIATVESIGHLCSIPYTEYRGSQWWRKRRQEFLDARPMPHACDLCSQKWWLDRLGDPHPLAFHVHHVSYERLGEEADEDLRLLCSACHNLVHFPDSAGARFWLRRCIRWALERGEDGEAWARAHRTRLDALRVEQ